MRREIEKTAGLLDVLKRYYAALRGDKEFLTQARINGINEAFKDLHNKSIKRNVEERLARSNEYSAARQAVADDVAKSIFRTRLGTGAALASPALLYGGYKLYDN